MSDMVHNDSRDPMSALQLAVLSVVVQLAIGAQDKPSAATRTRHMDNTRHAFLNDVGRGGIAGPHVGCLVAYLLISAISRGHFTSGAESDTMPNRP